MTTTPEHISNSEARKIILAAQGLHKANPFGSGTSGMIRTIEHLGYVQIDTISVVERAHHHVLWSRNPRFASDWLHRAQLKSRKIFEYWSHAAAYLPMKDYRYSLPVMDIFRSKKDRWPQSSKADMKKVMQRIREEGPLLSRDFESDHKSGTWWDWKPDKWALQRLYLEGHLMVSHREGFQRVYDFPENIIPPGTDITTPSREEYYTFLILNTLKAQGLASRTELFHLRHIDHLPFDQVLHALKEEQKIIPVKTAGQKLMFTLPEYLNKKTRLQEKITILSPFDNSVIWRNRLKDIFDFSYTLECYLPQAKRQYGYFCLPVLYKDKFIGRLDAKADRKKSELQVNKMFWEKKGDQKDLNALFTEAVQSYARFNLCERVRLL